MDYKVSLSTKLKPPQKGMIVVEPEDYNAGEIALLRKDAKVLAYLSVGSVSDERSYYKELEPFTLKKLEDWPHERYLDLRYPHVREWLQNKARELKRMGFDGFWLDNIDIYEEYRTAEMFNAILLTIHAIKATGGYVMINGGSLFLTDMLVPHKVQVGAYKSRSNAKKVISALKKAGFNTATIEMDGLHKVQCGSFIQQGNADQLVGSLHVAGFPSAKRITYFTGKPTAYLDGVTQEEVFSLITNYSGKGKFGRQDSAESARYQAHMKRVVRAGLQGFLLEYTTSNTVKLRIRAFAVTAGLSGVCISDDVDL